MNSSIVNTSCNILSAVDFLAIIGVFVYLNQRINKLQGTHKVSFPEVFSSSRPASDLESKVETLQNEIDILLKRLEVYDQVFEQILNKIKENDIKTLPKINSTNDLNCENSPVRKTTIRKRDSSSLGVEFARKPVFVDCLTPEDSESKDVTIPTPPLNEDEEFSFLKD